MVYLRLSVAQDNLKQYPQALDSANKAVQYAKDGTAQNLAKQQQARLQKLMSAHRRLEVQLSRRLLRPQVRVEFVTGPDTAQQPALRPAGRDALRPR